MRRLLCLLFLAATAACSQTLTDDFSRYAANGEPTPDWLIDGLGVKVSQGAVSVDEGVTVWRKAPFAAAGTFAADLTAVAPKGRADGWPVAGIALWQDSRNYWAMNVVVAPERDGVRHRYLELNEMLDGHWLAQTEEGTKLTAVGGNDGQAGWRDGVVYRFELSWNPEGITGVVNDGGKQVAKFGWRWQGFEKAVKAGRPALRSGGVPVTFDNAAVTVTQIAAEPQRREPPKWVSRPGQAVAKPTGRFTTQKQGDRWWLLDPDGKPFYDCGTDHIRYEGHSCEVLGYAPYSRVSAAKYGSEEAWAKTATERLTSWNFNVVAAGHAPSTRYRGLAHILFAAFGSNFAAREWICEPIHWTGFPNVFSPDWPRWCRNVARQMAAESRDDPWCMGIFLDNELEWYGKHGSLVDEVFERGADHTAKQALLAWMKQTYGGLAGLNAAIGKHHADDAAFLADTQVPNGPKMEQIRSGFLKVIGERYFREACAAMRAADSEHLLMGCRFAGRAPDEVVPIAGKYNDVFTINTYPWVDLNEGKVKETPALLAHYYALAQKPMIITEWSFPALDAGLPCKGGAGMRVDTQAQKAECYRIFAEMIADLPFMVGYHYFMYLDEPAEGIAPTFPEDSNYGLINVKDEIYPELTAMATKVNAAAPTRHAQSRMPRPGEGAEPVFPPAGAAVRVRNGSSKPVTDLVALLDQPRPQLVSAIGLAPGALLTAAATAPALAAVTSLDAAGGGARWHCGADGKLFDQVSADGLALGHVAIAAHQVVNGHNAWVATNKLVSLQVAESDLGWVIDAVLAFVPETEGAEAAFRVGVRAAVLKAQPVAYVRPLWYENTDKREWTLQDAFVFCRPAIGGDEADDTLGGPAVPNYYLRFGAWTDAKLGGSFGAFSPTNAWEVSFFQDTGKHPDARFEVATKLTAGQRWQSPVRPPLCVYALREASGWRALTSRFAGLGQLRVEVPTR